MMALQHFPVPTWLENHPALDIFAEKYRITFRKFDNTSYLFVPDDLVGRLTKDIQFLERYPNLPSRLTTVQLDDFCSDTSINKELLERAKRLSMLTLDNVCAGLYIHALNINHHDLAIAVGKEIFSKGVAPLIVDNLESLSANYLERGLTNAQKNSSNFGAPYILLNIGLKSLSERKYLLEILTSAFSYYGKIVITSSMDYNSFKESLISDLPPEISARYTDRMRILFESSLPKTNTTAFNEAYNLHILTPSVADALRNCYSEYGTIVLVIDKKSGKTRFELIGFPAEIKHMISLDLEFYAKNPEIPSENICSTFVNYHPKNKSQARCLDKVKKLAQSNIPKGLVICGPPGVGKTHLAVAAGKHAFSIGEESYLVVGFGSDVSKQPPLSKLVDDVFDKRIHTLVIDDLNNIDNTTDFYLRKMITNYLNKGYTQRILITTNNPAVKAWAGFHHGNFEFVDIVGKSYR